MQTETKKKLHRARLWITVTVFNCLIQLILFQFFGIWSIPLFFPFAFMIIWYASEAHYNIEHHLHYYLGD